MTDQAKNSDLPQSSADASTAQNISGRGVFLIETVAAGVAVRTAFLAEDGRLIDIPAVFPDLMYAMNQIDELRQHVIRHFGEAAQIGSQVIAQHLRSNPAQTQTSINEEVNANSQVPLVRSEGVTLTPLEEPVDKKSPKKSSRSAAKNTKKSG